MIKFFHVFYILSILLLFTSVKVNGAKCGEEMGICNENCSSRCETSKNGKGICEKSSPNEVGRCKCLYECSGNDVGNLSPENKQCQAAIGLCSLSCGDDCCNQKCAADYPGLFDGHGSCTDIGGIPGSNQCICTYDC